jgi:UDP-N-acetylglucosamine 1-carboxyvinyltransferase
MIYIHDYMHNSSIDFEVTGPTKLKGAIVTNTSKNGAMGLMCAALLNKSTTILHGIPRIEEVNRMAELLESLDVRTRFIDEHTLEIVPPKTINFKNLDAVAAKSMRSALMLIGPFIHLSKSFSMPHAGGCKMGERTIEAHRHGLEEFGVSIVTHENHYKITHKGLRPKDIIMYEASDTAAENILMAAALIPGKTTIEFAPPNYQVQEVCFFLEALGVKIEGIGSTTLVVHGVKEINKPAEYTNSEDPIEAMMYIAAAATTHSKLVIKRAPIDFLKLELTKLKVMGLKFSLGKEYKSANGRTKLVDITVLPSKFKAPPDKLHALPYPGINTDNLPFFVPIATQAEGATLIHDWMWENRAIYFTELNRLGANITLLDPHRALVTGPTKLKAAQVVCPPALRPAVIVLIAMLAAEGTSVLRNVYSIKRGYEEVAEKLNSIGANIKVLKN